MNKNTKINVSDRLALIFFALIIIFGGAAQFFVLSDIISRLCAFGILVILTYKINKVKLSKYHFIVISIIIIPVLQILPIPISIINIIPNTDYIRSIQDAAEIVSDWQKISISPTRTMDSIFFLIIPSAAFLLGLHSDRNFQIKIIGVVLSISIISILIGCIQIADGYKSKLYFYEITNFGSPVGFFANRNHNGIFLAISILLIIPFIQEQFGFKKSYCSIAIFLNIIFFASIILTESRAAFIIGFGCFIITLLQIFDFLKLPNLTSTKNIFLKKQIFVIFSLLIVVLSLIVLGPTQDRFVRLLNEGFNRSDVYPIIFKAWKDFWLLGSGLGSFEWVAPQYEQQENITYVYWNHAHNDYAQLMIELGVFGILLILVFSYIYMEFTLDLFRNSYQVNSVEFTGLMILSALALHSLFDYPLRTPALSAIFFFFAGLLAANRLMHRGIKHSA